LSLVKTSAAHGDCQVHAHAHVKLLTRNAAAKFKRLVWAAKTTLAVNHDWQLIVLAGNPAVSLKLTKGKGEVANGISR
jgi:hypothetical protein